mgnify:CR=1 FL=1
MSGIETQQIIKAIRNILSDFSKLDDMQLAAVINGEAKFTFVQKKERKKPTNTIDKTMLDQWEKELEVCKTEEEASIFINKLNLSNNELKLFAKHIGCSLMGATKKINMIQAIVKGYVGIRLRNLAIRGK